MVLIKESDVRITRNVKEGEYTYNDTFSGENNFFIAAALTEYDENEEIEERPEIGELIIEHYGWGYEEFEL